MVFVHRYLTDRGIKNLVVDSSSIEVNRRSRRAKTDRLDLRSLVRMLIRYAFLHGFSHGSGIPGPGLVNNQDFRHCFLLLSFFKSHPTNAGDKKSLFR
jgi:hypothetical protein